MAPFDEGVVGDGDHADSNRAFAAEITAPRNLIRAKARRNRLSHDDVYDLAGDLQIGPDVVKKQALNNGIEVAPN
ncbi:MULTISPECIES: hypothetical protein [unclassified Bradyrhizobium]|uniref:hypothetical protein n=1 Tax=unclassified Bradyrhizobium TaxID=2631580 RepID=UPI00339285D9